jgi:hypothetical protein
MYINNNMEIEFLSKYKTLMVRIRPHKIEKKFNNFLIEELNIGKPLTGCFFSITLKEPQIIIISEGRKARLKSCMCVIPSLDNHKAKSIHQAYMMLSKELENHRSTHTGNIFEKVYYQDVDEKWYKLNNLRRKIEN